MPYVVTISATFGAGGGAVGPAVAERLGVPFVDRAVPGAVAEEIGCSLEDALRHDDRAPTGFERLLASAARLPTVTLGSVDPSYVTPSDADGRILYDQEFVDRTEEVLERVAATGAVVLGRAGAVVLADRPGALHVRLDGPKDARLARSGTSDMRELEANDRARSAYVRRFYRVDPADSALYHLVLDATAVSPEACTDVIVRLARERAPEM
ncbi:cytidylate kinase-like family protein [Nocardiopsis sp. RSe5-2]|uniref:Cytidylate kinase-like family protein n=1 Tax=Nocardiopsis endophytica TaxID=3018445 RepID=A0ABT4U223_9ACTN|nr:cytidylate kinase-like family protein [Nocardiopsis endophytica]MDA2810417.1 cytidylate kinase-like family protein [Nocardiopsis endophytica]